MADPTAVSVILDPLILVFNGLRSVNWTFYLGWVFHIISLPLRLLIIPLRFLASVLFVLFSPALYILGYIYGCITAVLGFMASLEPLYTFFGAAASVGIVAGLTLAFSSTIITSLLGMQDTEPSYTRQQRRKGYITEGGSTDASLDYRDDEDEDEETPPSSSNEKEWQWLEPSPSRRRPASGLLSQTILEEDDDSE